MSEFTSTMKRADVESATASHGRAITDAVLAYSLLRLTFGINIMLHGVTRLLAPQGAFLAYLTHYFEKTPLMPAWMLPPFSPWCCRGVRRSSEHCCCSGQRRVSR